jgi:hypothetical protein
VRLLLDTHLLLWAAGRPERLSAAARKLRKVYGDPDAFAGSYEHRRPSRTRHVGGMMQELLTGRIRLI